jgi:MarR family transcriptional regulator, organic hydroperoxide resistance regulator
METSTETLTRQAVTPGLDLDGMDQILGIHVGTLNSLLLSRLERQLETFKVTPKQVAILWLVNANPGVKQSDLSRFFKIERPTVHQFVRQLTLNGHLVSEPSKLDRRAGGLWITETGAATLTAAREIIFTDEAGLLSPLTPAERDELYRLIIKVYLSASNRA